MGKLQSLMDLVLGADSNTASGVSSFGSSPSSGSGSSIGVGIGIGGGVEDVMLIHATWCDCDCDFSETPRLYEPKDCITTTTLLNISSI